MQDLHNGSACRRVVLMQKRHKPRIVHRSLGLRRWLYEGSCVADVRDGCALRMCVQDVRAGK